MMCPDKVQTLYTVPLFWSGEGACSWPKNTTRDKRSDMINAAFVLAVLAVITLNIHIIHPRCQDDIGLVSSMFGFLFTAIYDQMDSKSLFFNNEPLVSNFNSFCHKSNFLFLGLLDRSMVKLLQ